MTESTAMSPEAIDVFARGLHHLASVDGMDDRERRLIEEFLRETDSGIDFESLRETSFSPTEAAMMLETSYLRRLFIKVAVALVKADGTFSDAERHAIGEIADAFGLSNADFGDLEQQASRVSLE
jgi:tellurite resistance protein